MDKEVTWPFSISHILSEAYEKQNIIQSGADFTSAEIRNTLA